MVGERSHQCPSGFALDSVGPFCAGKYKNKWCIFVSHYLFMLSLMDICCHFASYLLITIVLCLILQVRKLRSEKAECLSSLSYQMAELDLDLRQMQSRAFQLVSQSSMSGIMTKCRGRLDSETKHWTVSDHLMATHVKQQYFISKPPNPRSARCNTGLDCGWRTDG